MRVSKALGMSLAACILVLSAGGVRAQVLGTSTEPLSAEKAREAECPLGDLVADVVRAAMHADLALVQASQLRQTVIPAGDLTRQALTSALPYPDEEVVLVTISGDQLWSALERGLSMLPKPSTAFLQVSGLTATFRSNAAPGQRLDTVNTTARPFSRTSTYRTAMPASLAKGALGYFRILQGPEIQSTGPGLADALCDYVNARKVISPPTDPRLEDLSADTE